VASIWRHPVMSDSRCPNCGTLVHVEQKTCYACGSTFGPSPPAPSPVERAARTAESPPALSPGQPALPAEIVSVLRAAQEKQGHRRKIQSGRGAIMAVAILTFIGGFVMF